MGLEFAYQDKFEYTTVDTLALRENVKKFLQNANAKTNTSKLPTEQTLNNNEIKETTGEIINNELTSTMNFFKSDSSLKLLNLTKREIDKLDTTELADILEFKIDESKKNIFVA